jgi:hypothetical protein
LTGEGWDEGDKGFMVHPHAQRRRLRRVPLPSPIEGGGAF